MDNIPNIIEQSSPFTNQDDAVVSLFVFFGYVTQAGVSQFMEVSQLKYRLRLTAYLDYSPS